MSFWIDMGRKAKSPAVPVSWQGQKTPFPPGGHAAEIQETQIDVADESHDVVADLEEQVGEQDQDAQPAEDTQRDLQEACHPPNLQI